MNPRKIELLAPAKNLECGIEAINHGADAVYIGSPSFGARASAANSLQDIQELATYAHLYHAKVYVALNTILSDDELPKAEQLIWDLYQQAKVDAIIVQDMGITQLNLPPIPLHASTQIDTRTTDKASFLEKAGFQQIVLARELAIDQIKEIADNTTIPLEAFVHGSLCVSYSGQCYLSQALSGRSANKGSCAQFCRLPYTLTDAKGEEIVAKKHLLSMKDLNLADQLEDLLDAGISSLKIEGRLKDVSYVKNTVAFYRQQLDAIFARRPQYIQASSGKCTYAFQPQLNKSFNRGFTTYFAQGRAADMWSIDSPKSIGEPIGKVVSVGKNYIETNGKIALNNADGICFMNQEGEMEGTQINTVAGAKLYPSFMPSIKIGTALYRNFDQEFEKLLAKKTSERKIGVKITLTDSPQGFVLAATDEDANTVVLEIEQEKAPAQKEQTENIKLNLSKTGNTIFQVLNVDIQCAQSWFIPASMLSEWRRQLTDQLLHERTIAYKQKTHLWQQTTHPYPNPQLTYLGNVMNEKSSAFYTQHQSTVLQPALEKEMQRNIPLMFTRHCIKQSLGYCPKENKEKSPYDEPFFITHQKTHLRLHFDCKKCEMQVFNDFKNKVQINIE